MKITAYFGNYRKYGVKNANTNEEAEAIINTFYNGRKVSVGIILFKIDNSKLMTYNEARMALEYEPSRYAE